MAEKTKNTEEVKEKVQKVKTNATKGTNPKGTSTKTTTGKENTSRSTKVSSSETNKTTTATTSKKSTTKTIKKTSTSKNKTENARKQAKQDDERVKKLLAEQLASMEKINKKNEQIEKIEEKKRVEKKSIQKTKKYNPQEIEKKLEDKKKLPKEEKSKLYKSMIINVFLAVGITVFFIFLNLGCLNIPRESFLKDLKVFSMELVGVTIILFEIAYKKDNDAIALVGIEFLIVAVITLISIYICILHENLYMKIINFIIMLIDLYYIIKCTFIYLNGKRKYKNSISDVKEIIEEE